MAENYFVHETSIVDDGAIIGEGTKIWHFSHIMKDARIGRNCIFGQNTSVAPGVKIGNAPRSYRWRQRYYRLRY